VGKWILPKKHFDLIFQKITRNDRESFYTCKNFQLFIMQTIPMKKMFTLKTVSAFIFIFLMISRSALAQDNFKPITLYTYSGDSIQGLIVYKKKLKTFKLLTVQEKNTGITKKYSPVTIQAFTIELADEKINFKSLITEADYSLGDDGKISSSPEVELTKDTVFAQSLVKGKLNLYYYIDHKVFKEHFLIEMENGPAMDLIYKAYYTDASRTTIDYNRKYKSQLRSLLADSRFITKNRINETPFSKKEIAELIQEYNLEMAGTAPPYEHKEEKTTFDFGVVMGANKTSIFFKSPKHEYSSLSFKPSLGFNAGLVMNVRFPHTRKRLSLYNELLYSSYKSTISKGFYEYYDATRYYEVKSANIEATYLKLVTAIRYQGSSHFYPFVQLGFVNGYAIQHATNVNYEMHSNAAIYMQNTPILEFRSFEQSLFGGIGLQYKKIALETRYERGNGMSKNSTINSVVNYMYLLLSYRF
jgi:hypothetical protein